MSHRVDLPAEPRIRRILVIKWSAMGDVIIASALFEDIARAFPNREIQLNTLPAWKSLFEHDARFDRVFAVELRDSYGLAAVLAAFLTLYLASGWRAGGRSRAMFLAVNLCALWRGLALAFVMTGKAVFLAGSLLADVLRFGGWYFFLLVLMKPEPTDAEIASARFGWLSGFSWLLVVIALASQLLLVFGIDLVDPSQRVVLFVSLAMTVFGLVLVERLFRNVSPDFRWSIKPLCLGLGGVFLFDLYLYSHALLFNRVDADAFSIRGFAHALGLPLVALSAIRSHDWKRRLVMSQRAALQSVTLLIVGIYLLFMAAAGYYVRFFGGEWGRALQLALLFAALLVLFTSNGSRRAWRFRSSATVCSTGPRPRSASSS